MAERDVIKSLIDFSFIIKAQLETEETTLLRSLLSMTIMEAEDVLEALDDAKAKSTVVRGKAANL